MNTTDEILVLAKAAGHLSKRGMKQISLTVLETATNLVMTVEHDAQQATMARLNSEYKKAGGR